MNRLKRDATRDTRGRHMWDVGERGNGETGKRAKGEKKKGKKGKMENGKATFSLPLKIYGNETIEG